MWIHPTVAPWTYYGEQNVAPTVAKWFYRTRRCITVLTQILNFKHQ